VDHTPTQAAGTPSRYRRIAAWLPAAALLAVPAGVLAQAAPDSVPAEPYRLDELVVVADRYATTLRSTVTATSVLTRADLDALPARTLAEALETVPGLIFVEQDGSGRLPIAIARGFFGGGETSYVLLTVDGVPVNDGRTGLVEWSRVPLEDVERIEVLRGSASASYGDAALGAVINVVTRRTTPPGELSTRGSVSVSSWGGAGIHASARTAVRAGELEARIDYDRDDGFREHSRSNRLAGSFRLGRPASSGGSGLSGRLALTRLFNQDPGPLPVTGGAFDRRASHPAFGGDERTRSTAEVGVEGRQLWSGGRRLDGAVRVRWYDQRRTRTLLLTPTFGDTQLQDDHEAGVWARTQLAEPLGPALLRVGGEVEGASYRTRYTDPSTGDVLTSGDARQWKLGLHGELSASPTDRLRLVGGLRFDAVLPTDETSSSPASPSFHQWSPRLGVNLAYRDDRASAGNLYVSWTRAFKAPTLDQLYDVRAIPTGQPGETISISNPDLRPQRSTAVEAGVYQRLPLGDERFAELSLSAYRQTLEDEIDFDIVTYSYGNILASRHTGVELSVRAVLSTRLELTHAATLGRAVFRTEANRGNQLKNIPEHSFTTTARVAIAEPASLALTHRAIGRVWLDDANTESLPGRSLFDAAAQWRVAAVDARLAVRNVFGTEYGSFGFLLYDPFADQDVRMIHPGMGRAIELRLTVGG
jgi:outer membrane cobalamin receptor